jgi:hypothetical protein
MHEPKDQQLIYQKSFILFHNMYMFLLFYSYCDSTHESFCVKDPLSSGKNTFHT